MIIAKGAFLQNKMKCLITSHIVYQLIFYTRENQNKTHFTKVHRKLVLCPFNTTVSSSTKGTASSPFFHTHQYVVVEGIEVVELS